MENAEAERFARREDEAARGHQRRGAGDDCETTPERRNVEPIAMGKRQRNPNKKKERARRTARQEPHLRRERQHRRGKPEVGQVPAQVVDSHAHERQPARAIYGVDAARVIVSAAVGPGVGAHGAAASNKASSRMNAPSYSTAPVISTWSSEPRHSMMRSPPGRRTAPLRSMSSSRAAATKVAQAADPQARVRPTPRSHTRALTSSRARTSANVTLAFSGNIGSTSILGPRSAPSTLVRFGTKNTAWGLPMLTTEASPSAAGAWPSGHRLTRRVSGTACRSGMASQSRRGGPMSTR